MKNITAPENVTMQQNTKQHTSGSIELANSRNVEPGPELLPDVRGQTVANTRANQMRADGSIVCTHKTNRLLSELQHAKNKKTERWCPNDK